MYGTRGHSRQMPYCEDCYKTSINRWGSILSGALNQLLPQTARPLKYLSSRRFWRTPLVKVSGRKMRDIQTLSFPLSRLQLKHLDCYTFYEPSELVGIDIIRHNKFVTGSMRFVDMQRSFESAPRSFGHNNGQVSLVSYVNTRFPF